MKKKKYIYSNIENLIRKRCMIMGNIITIATILISLAVGIVLGMIIRKKIAESKIEGAEQEAKRLVDLAKIEAENLKKEDIIPTLIEEIKKIKDERI